MRYRLTAALTGTTTAQQAFRWTTPAYTVGLELGENDTVTHIWAATTISAYRDFLPRFTIGKPGPHEIVIPEVPQHDTLLEALQFIESLGSFWMGIERLAWSEAAFSWVPDNEDEAKEITLSRFSHKSEYAREPKPVDPVLIDRILKGRSRLQYLTIPMSFFREGLRDHDEHRYVPAFYNFYFFLEDLYGGGKTKNRAILECFHGSSQLGRAFSEAHSQLADPLFADHASELDSLCKAIGCTFDPKGLIDFLVMIRGELHHYSQKSTRPKGHPLNQRQFRSVAFLALSVCLNVMKHLANGVPLDATC